MDTCTSLVDLDRRFRPARRLHAIHAQLEADLLDGRRPTAAEAVLLEALSLRVHRAATLARQLLEGGGGGGSDDDMALDRYLTSITDGVDRLGRPNARAIMSHPRDTRRSYFPS